MTTEKHNLKEIAQVFFKLGCIGFGGPAVHIAMMEDEVVRKRKWLTHEHFLDLIGATNLIPGPNSTEMTMHCGHERGGNIGLIVAGCSFIFPAVVITSIVAWLYQTYGKLPEVGPFMYGIKPAIIAIIVNAMITLGRSAIKTLELALIGILTLGACLFGFNEIAALFTAGMIGILLYIIKRRKISANGIIPIFLLQMFEKSFSITNTGLFLTFLKIGAILYGSGYVLFAFLDTELVQKSLLTRQVLIDAIAVGQFTPGPVFSAATFIGWQISGWWGAILATIGIFLPSFILVSLLNPFIPTLRRSKTMSAFLDAINTASIAIILSVVISMSRVALTDWRTLLIALASFMILFRFKKINSALIIAGSSAAGYLLFQM